MPCTMLCSPLFLLKVFVFFFGSGQPHRALGRRIIHASSNMTGVCLMFSPLLRWSSLCLGGNASLFSMFQPPSFHAVSKTKSSKKNHKFKMVLRWLGPFSSPLLFICFLPEYLLRLLSSVPSSSLTSLFSLLLTSGSLPLLSKVSCWLLNMKGIICFWSFACILLKI